MPRQKLTDKWLRNIPVPAKGQVDYFDVLVPGFGIRVSHGGASTFFVATRIKGSEGKVVRLSVGRFSPNKEVGDEHASGFTLAEARDRARVLLDNASRGIDPRRLRQDEIDENRRKAEITFGAVAADFMELYVERRLAKNTQKAYRTAFGKARKWNGLALASITRRDAIKLLDRLDAAGHEVAGDRAHAYLRKFFGWAVQRDYIQSSPMDGIRRDNHASSRDRVLSDAEVQWFWKAAGNMEWPFGPYLRMLLLTAQRRNEVAGMRWHELSLQGNDPGWLIPGHRTKNGRDQWVPLTGACIGILEAIPRVLNKNGKAEFVFTVTGNTPISGFSKAKQDVDEGMLALAQKADAEAIIPAWTLHDLRRSATTGMARLGFPIHVVEAVLNHKSGAISGVAAVYNRHDYAAEKRAALEGWANFISGLERSENDR
ncbi:MAG: site-specific integrase [Rhizobiaceae bacterium]|nr:site-specific integrase [Rhizobiaceae bacterium]